MKTRIMFYLVLVALFIFAGNSFAAEKAEAPSVTATPEENDEVISPQGSEGLINTFFGHTAGYRNTEGNYNSFFGRSAGFWNNGSANVFIGFNAGANEAGSNKLYIANSSTPTPLIWGDFSTNSIIINGNFRAIATAVVSDKRWKKNIQPLDSDNVPI